MPIVYLKRINQHREPSGLAHATYEEESDGDPYVGVLVLQRWTYATPPFPIRLRLCLDEDN